MHVNRMEYNILFIKLEKIMLVDTEFYFEGVKYHSNTNRQLKLLNKLFVNISKIFQVIRRNME